MCWDPATTNEQTCNNKWIADWKNNAGKRDSTHGFLPYVYEWNTDQFKGPSGNGICRLATWRRAKPMEFELTLSGTVTLAQHVKLVAGDDGDATTYGQQLWEVKEDCTACSTLKVRVHWSWKHGGITIAKVK
jgi:hypothetical protein